MPNREVSELQSDDPRRKRGQQRRCHEIAVPVEHQNVGHERLEHVRRLLVVRRTDAETVKQRRVVRAVERANRMREGRNAAPLDAHLFLERQLARDHAHDFERGAAVRRAVQQVQQAGRAMRAEHRDAQRTMRCEHATIRGKSAASTEIAGIRTERVRLPETRHVNLEPLSLRRDGCRRSEDVVNPAMKPVNASGFACPPPLRDGASLLQVPGEANRLTYQGKGVTAATPPSSSTTTCPA